MNRWMFFCFSAKCFNIRQQTRSLRVQRRVLFLHVFACGGLQIGGCFPLPFRLGRSLFVEELLDLTSCKYASHEMPPCMFHASWAVLVFYLFLFFYASHCTWWRSFEHKLPRETFTVIHLTLLYYLLADLDTRLQRADGCFWPALGVSRNAGDLGPVE